MKILIGSLLLMISLHGMSQSSTTFYFDESMHPATKKKAVISGTGKMDSGLYKLTCYYQKKKSPLASVAYFKDSTQQVREGKYQFYFENGTTRTVGNYRNGKKEGLWIDYDEKGNINDSTEYKDGWGVMRKGFLEIPAKHQKLVTMDDVANNSFNITLYNQHGEVISEEKIPQDYTGVYINNDTLCSFPGGTGAWQKLLTRTLMTHLDQLTDEDYGTVFMRFMVDTSGNITDVRPLTMQYSTLAKIAFNVIDGGPKWIPGQHEGKKVKMIRIQPVTVSNRN